MCIICGDLEFADVNHLEGVANNLSDQDLVKSISYVKKQLRNAQFLNVPEDVIKGLRKTVLVLIVEEDART